MSEPVWVQRAIVLIAHDEALAAHGGASGVRDMGLLDSALARPRNQFAYGENDVAALAAACGFGIVRNHPFVDGNKRAALGSCLIFLRLNGFNPAPDNDDWENLTLAVAAGVLSRDEVTQKLRALVG